MTGSKVGEDAIIEIGAVRFIGDALDGEPFQRLVQTHKSIPESVRHLTGIHNGMLRGAPDRDTALADLAGYIGNAPLVGHNVSTDVAFLRAAGLTLRNPLLDTYDLAVTVLPNLKSYTLEALATHLEVPATRFHRAYYDADTTRRVFLRLLTRLQALDPHMLDELARLPASGPWTVGSLLAAFPHFATSPAPDTALSGFNLSARMAEQQDISEGVFHLDGLRQPSPPPFESSEKMAAVARQAQAMVRPAVAQQMARLLAEGGALLLDLDNDHTDLVSLLAPAARGPRTARRSPPPSRLGWDG